MKQLKILLTAFLLTGIMQFAGGQTYKLSGVVSDSKTHETMPGANVVIKGTNTGATTNLEGRFTIANLNKGTYTIVISYISYNTVVLENIRVNESTPELSIEMEESVASLEGVTITAARRTNTDLSVINSIKKAAVISSGISAQQISRSQDKDASDVVKRIPGVSVADNRYIRIRGLGERYNNVLLNETAAPSMETDVRSFSFDIVPSSLIERILIFKSPAPDLPGDFSGGVVRITTKSIPEENFAEVSYGTGYREGSSLKEFKSQKNSNTYFTGFNDGSHDLPAGFPSDLRSVSPEELLTAGRSLPNSWVPVISNAGLNHSFTLTGGLRFKKNNVSVGNITSLIYTNSKDIRHVERFDYMQYDVTNDRSTMLFHFLDKEYTNNIRAGILHNWTLSLGEKHRIEFRNFYNRLSRQQYVLRTGIHYDFNYVPENHSFDQIYRGIYSGELSGSHRLAGNKLSIDWTAAYTNSFRDQPDYRRFRSDVDTVEDTRTLYIPLGSASSYFLGRFYSEMNEQSRQGQASVTWKPLNEKKPDATLSTTACEELYLKAGFFMENKNRDFRARNIGYVRNTQSDPGLQNLTIDQLFQPENINNTTGIRIDEQSNDADSYEASNNLLAAYLMINIPLGHKFTLNGGARAEFNNRTLESKALKESLDNSTVNVLPSVNITYSLNGKMIIRGAYGLTVNRPEFRELAPFGFYDFSYNLVKKGNKDLKNALIHNADLRWEYYPESSEIIMAGVFYKKFIHPIETQFVPGGGSGGIKDFSFANIDGAVNMGIEAEVRKSLAGLSSWKFVNNMSIIFNGALIRSRIQLDNSQVRQSLNRPMQGQSPYIINLGLWYRNMKNDLRISAMYNITGRYIFSIGFDVYPDVYQMPRSLLDLTVSKGIGNRIVLKAGISDILNQADILLQDANGDGKFDPEKDQVIQQYTNGTLFNAGITIKM